MQWLMQFAAQACSQLCITKILQALYAQLLTPFHFDLMKKKKNFGPAVDLIESKHKQL